MVWLTWRQHRLQFLVTVGLIGLLGLGLLWHGLLAAGDVSGLRPGSPERESALAGWYSGAYQVVSWLPAAPALIGLFWGAPTLTREFEKQTQLLAWTQSVPRRTWFAVKLGALTAAAAGCGLLLGVIVRWWLSVFSGTSFGEPFADPAMFASTGVAAGAWWAFAFVVGASVGTFVRRMLPAMVVTLVVFVAVMITLFTGRDAYAGPVRLPAEAAPPAGSMVAYTSWLGPAGELAEGTGPPVCLTAQRNDYLDCVREAGYRSVIYVFTPTMYWRFQWTETGLLLAGAALFGGAAAYRVIRRPA
jgi:ABC-type transport system involved in multi-copper enzyme maturation permease subunit